MNPLGALVGLFIGLVIVIAATLGPPVLVFTSSRQLGDARKWWLAASSTPGGVYWGSAALYGHMQIEVVWLLLGAGPLVYLSFLLITHKQRSANVKNEN